MLFAVEELLGTSDRRRSNRYVAGSERLASTVAPIAAPADATAEVGIPV
jgi:hypothetical protein